MRNLRQLIQGGVVRLAKNQGKLLMVRLFFAAGAAGVIGAINAVIFSHRDGEFGQTSLAVAGACLVGAAVFTGLAIDGYREVRRGVRRLRTFKALTLWTLGLVLVGLTFTTWLVFPGHWPSWASLLLTFTTLTCSIIILLRLRSKDPDRRGRLETEGCFLDDEGAEYPDDRWDLDHFWTMRSVTCPAESTHVVPTGYNNDLPGQA